MDKLNNEQTFNQEQAQQQLMHSLLQYHFADPSERNAENEIRIQHVLAGIDQLTSNVLPISSKDTAGKPVMKSIFTDAPLFGWAASACLVVVFLSFLSLTSKNALAEVQNIMSNLANLGDRVYQISVQPIGSKNARSPLSIDNMYPQQVTNNAKNWLHNSLLYIRGTDQYLLKTVTEKGNILRGRNQHTSWKVDQDKSIKYFSNFQQIKLPVAQDTVVLAFMDLPQLMAAISKNYELSYSVTEKTDSIASDYVSTIVAKKKSSQQKGVKQITLYYQSDTYQIEKIIFDRVHMQGDKSRYIVSMRRVDSEPLAEDFFEESYQLNSYIAE